MPAAILQAASIFDGTHLEAAAVFTALLAGKLSDHWKGLRRDKRARDESDRAHSALLGIRNDLRNDIDEAVEPLHRKMSGLELAVVKLESHVVGPDGKNGLRGEVREIQQDLRAALERELQAKTPVPARRRK